MQGINFAESTICNLIHGEEFIHFFVKLIGVFDQCAVPGVWYDPQRCIWNILRYLNGVCRSDQVMIACDDQRGAFYRVEGRAFYIWLRVIE